jgi:hypothetical protein
MMPPLEARHAHVSRVTHQPGEPLEGIRVQGSPDEHPESHEDQKPTDDDPERGHHPEKGTTAGRDDKSSQPKE